MAAWTLHGLCFGEEAGARNLVFFRVKWLQAAMKGTSCVRRGGCGCGRFAFFLPHCHGGFKLLWLCLCLRSYRVFWNLWLQIAVEWLHECCRCHVCRYVQVCDVMLRNALSWLHECCMGFVWGGCKSQWNGCMNVVTFCCHVRRYVQVCNVMLRNAL